MDVANQMRERGEANQQLLFAEECQVQNKTKDTVNLPVLTSSLILSVQYEIRLVIVTT